MTRQTRFATLLLQLSLAAATLFSQPASPLLDSRTFSLLSEEISGERAKDHVIAITRYHRIQGSRGYSEAARYVLSQLRKYGFSPQEAWIESFTSDGKVTYQTWQSPSGWHIETGELRMVAPEKELIVRYPEIGMSVITYSNAGHVRAELVDVGRGTSEEDYRNRDVRGKFVLATGYGGDVHRLAVLRHGAAAVVCYLDDERAALHPDLIQYTGMWPRSDELERVTFGFNISHRQGTRLKQLLAAGHKVVLEGRVEGPGLEPGVLDVVVALIPGTDRPDQELLFTAHLDHPKESANDNASGSAAILDLARTFKSLIGKGKLPRPRRTLRFLWVPELYGTMAYVDGHPELKGPRLGGNVLANLNLDMVGENLELLHSRMNLTWTPQSISSALTDVVAEMAKRVDGLEIHSPHGAMTNFNYRVTPFSGGSDHVVFNDGMIGIPSMMLGHWPDYTHHTTADTPDKVDPEELQRSELIAGGSFWYLATLDESGSLSLANLVAAGALGRLARDVERAAGWLMQARPEDLERNYNDGKRAITFATNREVRALESILDFVPSPRTRRLVETWKRTLEDHSQIEIRALQAIVQLQGGRLSFSQRLTRDEREAASWVPSRVTRGPLAGGLPERRLTPREQAWYQTPQARALDRYLLVNFIDGQRSILDLRNTLSAATRPVSLRAVDRFIRDLAKTHLVNLRKLP